MWIKETLPWLADVLVHVEPAPKDKSAPRTGYAGHLSRRYALDQPNQILHHPLVGRHLVVDCLRYDDPEGELLQIVFVLESLVKSSGKRQTGLVFLGRARGPAGRPIPNL